MKYKASDIKELETSLQIFKNRLDKLKNNFQFVPKKKWGTITYFVDKKNILSIKGDMDALQENELRIERLVHNLIARLQKIDDDKTKLEKNYEQLEHLLQKNLDSKSQLQEEIQHWKQKYMMVINNHHSIDLPKKIQLPPEESRSLQENVDSSNSSLEEIPEFSFLQPKKEISNDRLKKYTKQKEENTIMKNANTMGFQKQNQKSVNENLTDFVKELLEKDTYDLCTSKILPVDINKIPNWESTYFITLQPNGMNIFHNSIAEIVLMNSKGTIIYQKRYIKNSQGISNYMFDNDKEELLKSLSSCTHLVGFNLSNTLKYLFGNEVSLENIVHIDVKRIFQFVEQDDVTNDVCLCAEKYNPKTDVTDRTEINKLNNTRFLYQQLFARVNNPKVFFEKGQLPKYDDLIKEWHLERDYNIQIKKK